MQRLPRDTLPLRVPPGAPSANAASAARAATEANEASARRGATEQTVPSWQELVAGVSADRAPKPLKTPETDGNMAAAYDGSAQPPERHLTPAPQPLVVVSPSIEIQLPLPLAFEEQPEEPHAPTIPDAPLLPLVQPGDLEASTVETTLILARSRTWRAPLLIGAALVCLVTVVAVALRARHADVVAPPRAIAESAVPIATVASTQAPARVSPPSTSSASSASTSASLAAPLPSPPPPSSTSLPKGAPKAARPSSPLDVPSPPRSPSHASQPSPANDVRRNFE